MPPSALVATPASMSPEAKGGNVDGSSVLGPQRPAAAVLGALPGWQLSPAGQLPTLPVQAAESRILASARRSVGTCVSTIRCTIARGGEPLYAVTAMSTSW